MRLLFILTILFLFSFIHPEFNEKMVWNEEFETAGFIDTSKWSFVNGDGCPDLCGWGNNELQHYTDAQENVRVVDGKLIIEAHYDDSLKYTSAKLRSIADWKYGRFEIRAKLPRGRGTWPAIWMLPTDWEYGGWPKSGEIDIMEHVGFDQGKVHGTVHTESFNHLLGTQKGKFIELEAVDEQFHNYSIVWNENSISFFVDGKKYNHFDNTGEGYKEWPFDKPFYLILNLAVGGNWGGQKGVDEAIWPQRMEIEYVRIYKN